MVTTDFLEIWFTVLVRFGTGGLVMTDPVAVWRSTGTSETQIPMFQKGSSRVSRILLLVLSDSVCVCPGAGSKMH